jgi:hypothetical protein
LEISERGKKRISETVTKPPVGNTAIDGGGLLEAETHPFSRHSSVQNESAWACQWQTSTGRRGRAAWYRLGLGLSQRTTTGSGPNKIARSLTSPKTDDDGEEWPVHGIVSEDVGVFGISRYAHSSLSTHYNMLNAQPSLLSYEASLRHSFSPSC